MLSAMFLPVPACLREENRSIEPSTGRTGEQACWNEVMPLSNGEFKHEEMQVLQIQKNASFQPNSLSAASISDRACSSPV